MDEEDEPVERGSSEDEKDEEENELSERGTSEEYADEECVFPGQVGLQEKLSWSMQSLYVCLEEGSLSLKNHLLTASRIRVF